MSGPVSIVGAGPGDPGLLTLRAVERLERAEVVVYDALVRPEVLALAPAARKIFVGKRCGSRGVSQSRINALLRRLGRLGRRVVRLKGGDPFLFGRGAEEAQALAEAGLSWELVPGVSSCLAAPGLAGIPVTDRRLSSMVTVVTGHDCAGGPAVDWERLSPRGTLVVLMGLAALPRLSQRLIALGWPPATPAAALSSMSWPGQAVVQADLEALPEAVGQASLAGPAVIVIGDVVRLREGLAQGGSRHAGQEALAHT